MKKSVYLFTILLILIGCKPLSRTSLGVKNPKFKNQIEVYNFAKKHDVKLASIYYFANWESMKRAFELKYSKIPNAYFFNKNGDFVDYKKKSSDCNAKVDEFIENLENFSCYNSDSSKNINQILPLIKNDKSDSIIQNDITVIISWASFMGDVNKEKAFEWIKLLEKIKQKDINLEYYLINYDLQKSWNLTIMEEKEIENIFKIF